MNLQHHTGTLLPCLLLLGLMLPVASAADISPAAAEAGDLPRFVPRTGVYQQHGNLQLNSVLVAGGEPYPGTQFSVLREEPDAFGKSRYHVMAAAGPHAHAEFDLSPGRYTVQARNGAVTVEQVVEVPENGALAAEVILDAGELHLGSVLDAQGLPADETWFRVLREDTDAYGRPARVQVAGNGYGQTASFLLPAGSYVAEASYGDARTEEPVRILAGGVTSRELVLNAGRLEVYGTLAEGGEPVGGTAFSILRRAAGGGEWNEVAHAAQADKITFILPQGDYRVRAQLDGATAELVAQVRAGETQSLEIPLEAGELTVYATLAGESDALLDAWFDVQPLAGAQPTAPAGHLRGPAHNAHYVLPAGSYRALAGLGESEGGASVDIAAGSSQTLAVDLDAARVTLSLVHETGDNGYPYTWFSIYRIEQDGAGREWRRRLFNAGYYPHADVVLPAGRYIAFARSDEHRGETSFAVAPGEIRRVPIIARP